MDSKLKAQIEAALEAKGIHLTTDWSVLPQMSKLFPMAMAYKKDTPMVLQYNGHDAVFVYGLKDEIFFRR